MTIDPRKVSFSQAQGLKPLPTQLELGQINREARIDFWNAFFAVARENRNRFGRVTGKWLKILSLTHAGFFREPLDQLNDRDMNVEIRYKSLFLNAPYNDVFDLLVFLLRLPDIPVAFKTGIKDAFEKNRLAYVLDVADPVTIYPASTHEEGQATVLAVHQLEQAGLSGARQHLSEATTLINQRHWANSIKESISAVESVAREIAPGTQNLGSALNQLGHRGMLEHPSLRNGLEKLYEYTNEEGGIRHARLNEDASNVGQDEAVFMLGACASFASYLWRKHLAMTR